MDKKKELILEQIKSASHGLTIQNIINRTKLARGTVKTKLLYLMLDNKVIEINYGQNVKVYWLKRKLYRNKISDIDKKVNSLEIK